jgi:prefoldin subunit 5
MAKTVEQRLTEIEERIDRLEQQVQQVQVYLTAMDRDIKAIRTAVTKPASKPH